MILRIYILECHCMWKRGRYFWAKCVSASKVTKWKLSGNTKLFIIKCCIWINLIFTYWTTSIKCHNFPFFLDKIIYFHMFWPNNIIFDDQMFLSNKSEEISVNVWHWFIDDYICFHLKPFIFKYAPLCFPVWYKSVNWIKLYFDENKSDTMPWF